MKIKIPLLISAVILALCFSCLTAFASESGKTDDSIDPSKFDGKKIGIQTGTVHEGIVHDYIDSPQLCYYRSVTDGAVAVESGKIDAFMSDYPVLQYYTSNVEGVECRKIESSTDKFATAAGKTEKGRLYISQLNKYLAKIRKSGEMDKLTEKWVQGPEEKREMSVSDDLPATNGEITIATPACFPPMTYVKGNEPVGLEIEIVLGFCREYGYRPVLKIVETDGVIAGTATGKFDLAISSLTITEERKETLLFADSYYTSYVGLAVKNDGKGAVASIADSVKEGLRKTFITDDRWKLFVSGVCMTLKITVLSIIFGSILGFLVHVVCRRGNALAGKISAFARWLIQGMPEVVLLMIMYYIVFGKTSLAGETVAIIVFSLCFACAVHNMLEVGENSLDPGQKTAAIALGYSEMETFMRIIMPQLARGFLPTYLTAVSTHIKGTAVVGYIAVVDITKVGDIVRGATYEAFFPLISVAVLYFLMAGLLRMLIRLSAVNLNPERRSEEKILRGAVIK